MAKPIQPRHQRVLQGRGNRQRRQWPASTHSGHPSAVSNPDSTTVLVNSSTNNGTPSVLATICCTTSAGKRFAARHLARPSPRPDVRPKRLSVSWLRCDRFPQGGMNSGRKVSSANSRVVGTWSSKSVSTSSVEGSAQCRSSQAQYTAAFSASSTSHATKAACVFSFCFCGLTVIGGVAFRMREATTERPTAARYQPGGSDSDSACAGVSPAWRQEHPRAQTASRRCRWSMIGYKALFW